MRPSLAVIDFVIIGIYVVFAIGVGSLFVKVASKGVEGFFVGDRKLSWWVAGTSIVATTFAADTPLAVTGIVAADGVSGNWIWWAWAIAHVSATFFFARMWRRSGVITDAEITEVRYSGKAAAGLRAFKALYFGIFINCLTMAWVISAMVKISRAFFDVSPATVIAGCILVSVTYTTLGGFRSVVITDLVQFTLGMGGAILLAVLVVNQMGGIGEAGGGGLVGQLETTLQAGGERALGDVLDFVPGPEHPSIPPLFFFVLLIAGWWRYAEGNGYIVQRLAACKDEGHAQGASLWFAVAHNALRPWPWILVGLASLVVYPMLPGDPSPQLEAAPQDATATGAITITPGKLDVATGGELSFAGVPSGCKASVYGQTVDIADGKARFSTFANSGVTDVIVRCGGGSAAPPFVTAPGLHVELLDREMGYPLMMGRTLPPGLLGLVIASLLAAFMSTIDTHTNWGASYLVQDVYRRFLKPDEDERHYVRVSRVCIVLMAVLAGISALYITNIASVWRFLINLGAGLGSVVAVRWFWSRVTPYAEFAAMGVTTLLAVSLELFCTTTFFGGDNPLFLFAVPGWLKIIVIAGVSLATWIPVALWGPRNDEDVLRSFASKVRPPGPGFAGYVDGPTDPVWPMALRFVAGVFIVFFTLFGIGGMIFGDTLSGVGMIVVAAGLLAWIIRSTRDREQA